jgi:hypothetical protein
LTADQPKLPALPADRLFIWDRPDRCSFPLPDCPLAFPLPESAQFISVLLSVLIRDHLFNFYYLQWHLNWLDQFLLLWMARITTNGPITWKFS